jgi:hypothetical protein
MSTLPMWLSALFGNNVHGRRRERGEGVQAFVPQVHAAGVEAEVDWGEAQVAMAGTSRGVYLFHMRACHFRGQRSRWRFRTAPSRRFWRRMSRRSTGSVGCSACFAMTT